MQFRKVMATAMVVALATSSLVACGNVTVTTDVSVESGTATETQEEITDYGSGDIVIWVADAVVDFTKEKAEAFIAENEAYSGYTITVEAVGEGDAATKMTTDVASGADIYGFPQDQLARLVSAGAIASLSVEDQEWITEQNDAGAVSAACVGDIAYAYPMTSDNGYFLYYDSSVITDASTLEGILEQCEAADKSFYMNMQGGWYQTAFFFGTGCELTYDTDEDGAFTACNINYDSDAGVVALREIIDTASSKAFVDGSSIADASNVAAIVDGTWDAEGAKAAFGDNYACAKLPTFTGSDGNTYQMSGFGGFKLLGVKPQTEAGKLAVCNALAKYLTSEEVQLERYDLVSWGPSNLNAQASDAVKSDEALSALAEQLNFCIPQGQYPDDYWTRAESLVGDIYTGNLTQDSSDDDIRSALASFQADCVSYAE